MADVMEKLRSTLSSGDVRHCYAPAEELVAKFRSVGIEVLGAGSFGVVVDNGYDVIKTFSTQEPGYGAFIKYMKGKSSVLFPKITHVGSFGPWTCVRIEKLEPLRSAMGYELTCQLISWIQYYSRRRVAKKNNMGGMWAGVKRHKFPAGAEAFVNKANFVGCLEKMIDFMLDYNSKNEKKIRFDLHDENFMVRNGNQLVFTDPWADE